MNKDVIYIIIKNGDKNHSIQLWSDDTKKIENLHNIFNSISFNKNAKYHSGIFYPKFLPLNLFLQGNENNWVMLETWSNKEDLLLEFGEFCAKKLNLPIDII